VELGVVFVALLGIVAIFHAREKAGQPTELFVGSTLRGEARRRDFEIAAHFVEMSRRETAHEERCAHAARRDEGIPGRFVM